MKIFIGASSNDNLPDVYKNDCKSLLELILKDNDLVFGSSTDGLMGIAYNVAKKNNRRVIGICPEIYRSSLDNISCDEAIVTPSIVDSTLQILKTSDAAVLLPGGNGTLLEFFTANYTKLCKEINIPVILYNSNGYYDKLIEFIDELFNKGYVRHGEKKMFVVANNPDEVLKYLERGE